LRWLPSPTSRPSFPPCSSIRRHRLPSKGSSGKVPLLQRYCAVLRIPAARPTALRRLRLAVPRLGSLCAPRRGRAPPAWVLGLVTRLPSGTLNVETTGPPRFLDIPHTCMPRSWTPVKSRYPARSWYLDSAFRNNDAVGLHDYGPFGARSRGLHAPCVRFAKRVTPTLRNTRFRLEANLGRAGV